MPPAEPIPPTIPATLPELSGNIDGTCAKIAPSEKAHPSPTAKAAATAMRTFPVRPASVMPNIVKTT